MRPANKPADKSELVEKIPKHSNKIVDGKRVRYGLIGCGHVASKYASALQADPHAELTGVFDIDRKRAEAFAGLCNVPVFPEINELLSHADAIIIGTPHHTHAAITETVLRAGKFAICEKPLFLTARERGVIAKLPEVHERLLVVFQQRFHKAVNELHNHFIQDGSLPIFISAAVRWPRDDAYFSESPWRGRRRTEGGLLYNQGIHVLDIILSLFPPTHHVRVLSAEKFCLTHSIDTEDTLLCWLMIGKAIVNIEFIVADINMPSEASLLASTGERSIQLCGKAFTQVAWKRPEHGREDVVAWGDEKKREAIHEAGHTSYIQAASRYILGGRRDIRLGGFTDALRVADVISEIYRKSKFVHRLSMRRRSSASRNRSA